MDFNIYVLGDAKTFYTTLNAVAMFFSNHGMMNSTYLLGSIVTLISAILFVIGRQSDGGIPGAIGPAAGAFSFAAIVATSTITSTVYVNDIYSGNTIKVDNVPLLISMPASAFTTGMYKIFDKANVSFQSVDGSYMAVSQQGFVTPLKILYALRSGFKNYAPGLSLTVTTFIQDCIPNSDTFNKRNFANSVDSINYIIENARPNGMTTTYDDASTSANGTVTSCVDAGNYIKGKVQSTLANDSTVVRNVINAALKEKNPFGTQYSGDDVAMIWEQVLPPNFKAQGAGLDAAQTAQTFMSNALAYNTIHDTFGCMQSVGDPSAFNSCNINLTQASEQFRNDSAAAGSYFSKLMFPAMTFMQLMFFGFAPIVIIFGLLKGGGALPLYLKYLVFGVWTSSWLPFSAIIQMYIQNDVYDKLSQLPTGALTYSTNAQFYDILANRLAIASDMLAATPLVSFALLTGGAMAMTSLANRYAGRDYVDEKATSPALMQNGALVSNGPQLQMAATLQGDANTGVRASTTPVNQYSLGSALDSSVQSASALASTTTHSANESFNKMRDWAERNNISFKNSNGEMVSVGAAAQQRVSQTEAATFQALKSAGISDSEAVAFVNEMKASGGFSAPMGLASIQAGLAASKSLSASAEQRKAMSEDIKRSVGSDKAWADDVASRVSHSIDHSNGVDKSSGRSLSHAFSDSVSKASQASESYQTAAAMRRSMSSNFTTDDMHLGAQILSRPGAQAIMSQAVANMSPEQREHFNKAVANERQLLQSGGASIVGSEWTAQYRALAAMGGNDAALAGVLSNVSGAAAPGDVNFDRNANLERPQEKPNGFVVPTVNGGGTNGPSGEAMTEKAQDMLSVAAPNQYTQRLQAEQDVIEAKNRSARDAFDATKDQHPQLGADKLEQMPAVPSKDTQSRAGNAAQEWQSGMLF